jgi:hypothetical protein
MAAKSNAPVGERGRGPVALRSSVPEELVLLRRIARLPRRARLGLIGGAMAMFTGGETPESVYLRWKQIQAQRAEDGA